MIAKERHAAVIERLNKLVDSGGKSVGSILLKKMDMRLMLKNRNKAKRLFLALAVKQADELFTQVKQLGSDFAEEKINASIES